MGQVGCRDYISGLKHKLKVLDVDDAVATTDADVRTLMAEEDTFHIDVIPLEESGSYNVSVSGDSTPDVPTGISSARN